MRFALWGLLLALMIFVISGGHVLFLPLLFLLPLGGLLATAVVTDGGASPRRRDVMTRSMLRSRLRMLSVVGAIGVILGTMAVAPAPAKKAPSSTLQLASFHTRFGGSRFGGGGLFSLRRPYRYSYGRRPYSRPSLLHRVVRAVAIAYILHLLFTNGVFSILLWILVIAIISRLFRRRPRRYSY